MCLTVWTNTIPVWMNVILFKPNSNRLTKKWTVFIIVEKFHLKKVIVSKPTKQLELNLTFFAHSNAFTKIHLIHLSSDLILKSNRWCSWLKVEPTVDFGLVQTRSQNTRSSAQNRLCAFMNQAKFITIIEVQMWAEFEQFLKLSSSSQAWIG